MHVSEILALVELKDVPPAALTTFARKRWTQQPQIFKIMLRGIVEVVIMKEDVGKTIFTIQEVVDEITNKRQLRRLVVLPYDLQLKDVFQENIKYKFSKKTGDYPSLSATDIKVIALTFQLEKEKVGIDHLQTEPKVNRVVSFTKNNKDVAVPSGLAGFYLPKKLGQPILGVSDVIDKADTLTSENKDILSDVEDVSSETHLPGNLEPNCHSESEESEAANDSFEDAGDAGNESGDTDNFEDACDDVTCESEINIDDILVPVKNMSLSDDIEKEDNDDGYDDDDDVSDDEDASDENEEEAGWITPGNIAKVKKEMYFEEQDEKQKIVACITGDFAMQNVMKQLGLNVLSVNGRMIRQLRTFILRCYACFKTTSIMTKMFCPNCGNKTLKKVAVSLKEDGTQQIHINARRPLTARGKRFSLPTPKGGKHANNPILVEDQRIPQQRGTRLARQRNDPLAPDYIAGFSPFIMRDVNSRAAVLGIHGQETKHWMRTNPNQAKRKHSKKKK
uniref:RNA-binding protein NOB1 n=1 Tax=Timema douglasi TaxID=61478 RepID=A0A7R8VMR9_TIMDO|nr:unnamed protein product [Timema douglasi]